MPEERRLRRRIPVSKRKFRPAQPSPWPRRRTPSATGQLSKKTSRPIEILQRCNSEPTLRTDDDNRNLTTPPDSVLFRPMTCTDVFSSADYLPLLQSPQKFEGYSKDSKVVVNVIVEGSPGPIRTMVKLGSSVEETIRLVVNKYCEEGRSPLLQKNSASTFQLYHSHFSLESLNKSDVIGDVGSRSFYLRKGINGNCSNSSSSSSNEGEMVESAAFFTSEMVSSSTEIIPATPTTPSPLSFLQAFIARNINIIIRTTCKLWRLLGCLHCS
ncbi:hypothetical protein CsSME_00050266 [Camellia sinensis var. sinensis]